MINIFLNYNESVNYPELDPLSVETNECRILIWSLNLVIS
jgi:hypothetical protein